jgi:hypothetical protein
MRIACLCLTLAAMLTAGCAFTNPNNTPLLTMLDESVAPESATGKALLSPVFVPVGLASGVLDICLIHPIRALGFASEDTYRVVWADPKGSFAAQSLRAVPKAVVTPVVFAFCWVGESLFDLRPQEAPKP